MCNLHGFYPGEGWGKRVSLPTPPPNVQISFGHEKYPDLV